jgi:hypothetical protein
MAHFAKINPAGVVEQVIVAEQDFIDSGAVGDPSTWVQTSYNTRGGVHYNPDTDLPSEDQSKALRKNYAGVGYTYDAELNAFIPPQPYDSWVLNEETCLWDAPQPMPEIPLDEFGDHSGFYEWDEEDYLNNSNGWRFVEFED